MDLQSLLEQKKKVLKSCTTTITNVDGRRYEVSKNECKEIGRSTPFVIDNKPDMQVAMVTPGLFLSSQDPTSCLEILEKYKIQHVLSLGVEPSVKFYDIRYSFVDLLDLPESDITEPVEVCLKIIHQNKKNNILVHCNAGVSRSATIIIAYLMWSEKISYEDAYKKVKSARNCIKPNEGFVKQLMQIKFNVD